MLPIWMVPTVSLPGFALACAIRSFNDRSFESGLTSTTTLKVLMVETGAKARVRSYGSFLNSECVMACELLSSRSVWPSGSALATISVAMMPPALGRLSMTTCWPSDTLIFCATARAVMSPTPPGPNGTRKRIGRVG
ncbi:hypothetical protein D3C83_40200 [compost metagenome]